jgi:hypothetical protein
MAHRGRAGVWFVGGLCLAVAAAAFVAWCASGSRRSAMRNGRRDDLNVTRSRPEPKTPLGAIAVRIARGENGSTFELQKYFAQPRDSSSPKLTEEEGIEYVGALADLNRGFGKANSAGKKMILDGVGKILARFGTDSAPSSWWEGLESTHAVFAMAMADADPAVRAVALDEVGRTWTWVPERSLIPIEEAKLADWKNGLYKEAVRHVADPVVSCRTAAVRCLAALPLNDQAAPALALMKDEDWQVRVQVLGSFAERPDLLSVEEILPMLYDRQPELADLSERVLTTRGLSPDQIGLAKMLVHPKVGVRESAIALLLKRDDIDQIVWLLFLSRDKDPTVRAKVVAALEGHLTPESRRRLEEMGTNDPSPAVRAAARKLVPATSETTVALPPLPGSPSLNPKAN